MRHVSAYALFLVLGVIAVGAENIRGPVVASLSPTSQSSATSTATLSDLVAVYLPEETRLIGAVQIEITTPDALLEYRGSFACAIYANIDQKPGERISRYTGSSAAFALLPGLRSYSVTLPLERLGLIKSQENMHVLEGLLLPADYPILVSIIPVMKGIPDRVTETGFTVTASLMPNEKSLLFVLPVSESPRIEPFVLKLDDSEVNITDSGYLLDPGFHRINMQSEFYKDQSYTVALENGQTETVYLELIHLSPKLIIDAPSPTEIFLDGVQIFNSIGVVHEVAEGNHTVLFRLGDYSVSKSFVSEAGKRQTLSIVLDVIIDSE